MKNIDTDSAGGEKFVEILRWNNVHFTLAKKIES